jgi:hypothetical protein
VDLPKLQGTFLVRSGRSLNRRKRAFFVCRDCDYRNKLVKSGGDAFEVKYSGDLGTYPSDADAIESAQRWAMKWCDDSSG